MPTFSQKPEATRQTASAKSSIQSRAHLRDLSKVGSTLQLQRTIGNRAMLRLLQPHASDADAGLTTGGVIQTKLAINRPGDEYEREADRVSEQVMRMPEPRLQRVQTKRVQAGDAGQTAAPPIVHEVLATSGRPLDSATRGFMETRFGRDFSRVRVHTDPGAAGSAEAIDARAYTVGHHVVFGAGEYRPETADGQRLLAHELTHVAQQDASAPLRGAVVQRDAKAPANAPKPTTGTKRPAAPVAQTEDPKVTALKTELVTTFGLKAVTDTSRAKWTAPQLEKMKRALARIPAAQRGAIKDVELRRVEKTSSFGATSAGLFQQEIAAGTGIRQDRIEIANDAFSDDADYEEGGARTVFGGQDVQGAPSEQNLTHEVGHALETHVHRQAEEARVKADIAGNVTFETLDKAMKLYNNVVLSSLNVPGSSNPAERRYRNAIIDAQKKLDAITKVVDNIPETPTAAQSKKGAADVKAALNPAKTAIVARNAARTALPQDSKYAMATEEAAQDAWMAAAVALVPALEGRAKAQDEMEKAHDAEDASRINVRVSSGRRVLLTRRLAEFVALIEANGIDIANSALGNHVTSHWPDNPEEAYAELYSFSITAPAGLRKFDKNSAVATYFTAPVGLKGAQNAQVAAWLARHK